MEDQEDQEDQSQVLALKLWLKHLIDLFDLKLNKYWVKEGCVLRERRKQLHSFTRLLAILLCSNVQQQGTLLSRFENTADVYGPCNT